MFDEVSGASDAEDSDAVVVVEVVTGAVVELDVGVTGGIVVCSTASPGNIFTPWVCFFA